MTTCRWCGVAIYRRSLIGGRGVEWIQVDSPSGVHCIGPQVGVRHQPDLPDFEDPVEVEAWLAGVKEGLDP